MDWDAIRSEYLAGGISQRALAGKHGVSYGALRQRAARENWSAQRRGREEAPEEEGDTAIALRIRRRLLMKLEHMANALPEEAVTEMKTQDDSAVKLFKLRDLTAAYREVTGEMELAAEGQEPLRILMDL